jgi:hypothetical protein
MRAEGIPGIFRAVVQQWRMDLQAFELVLLSRSGDAPDYPDEVLDRIQHEHVAYLMALRETGHAVTVE